MKSIFFLKYLWVSGYCFRLRVACGGTLISYAFLAVYVPFLSHLRYCTDPLMFFLFAPSDVRFFVFPKCTSCISETTCRVVANKVGNASSLLRRTRPEALLSNGWRTTYTIGALYRRLGALIQSGHRKGVKGVTFTFRHSQVVADSVPTRIRISASWIKLIIGFVQLPVNRLNSHLFLAVLFRERY